MFEVIPEQDSLQNILLSKSCFSQLDLKGEKQIKKKHQDLVSVERPAFLGLTSTDPIIRANQLEQNIRFLQEQHQIMLAGLHGEIEMLRQKNRDLQFQIVFSKGVSYPKGSHVSQSSSSQDEESPRQFTLSSSQVNITPLQVEILERNIAELRTNLSEARTRNVYLQNVIDEQKKKMSTLENEKLDLAAVGKKIGKENVSRNKSESQESSLDELREKLEGADRLIRILRRENEEQRKEIISLRTSLNKSKMENRKSEGNNSYRNYYRNGQSQNSRFPPLHSHQHWKSSLEHQGSQNSDRSNGRMSKESEMVGRTVPSLPYLKDRNNSSTSTGYSNPAYNNYQSANHKRGFYYHRKQDEYRGHGRTSRRDQQPQPDTER